ncbi:electron transport complex protein RnfG [Oleiphilus messinensis]|uniref:Ion-translocating oxidoreductase complex subunit G n=1 Tax=Oleiphilus messinensis TaxID=141451 RepID=A0A1Y0IAX8_9GAMM|nr:electron transport complex subunit RsxG [Oleiphilus messinensis]ARU57658.1 electron transport complex protein RnfG [Oleiphilus messinensis]
MNTITQSVLRSAIGLGLFAIITAGLIAATKMLTRDEIDYQIRKAQSKALLELVPENEHDNDLLADTLELPQSDLLGTQTSTVAYLAKKQNNVEAVILPTIAPDGYSGTIEMITAIERDGTLKGVRVLKHKETPGLGDKIEVRKSDWILAFTGKSLDNTSETSWKVRKDGGEFDQLTGATITPRAVVKAVHGSLRYFHQNKAQLLLTGDKTDDKQASTTNTHPATIQ